MELAFQQLGSGPPLIILHGLFGMSDNWLTIAKALADKYTIYLPDLRNHGRSAHSDNISFPLMSEDVFNFLQYHHLDQVVLLGHSLGGKVAIQVADKYPDFLSKLIIVDIANRVYQSAWFEEYIDVMLAIDLDNIETRKEAERIFLAHNNANIAIVQFLLKNLYRDNANKFKWRLNLSALKKNVLNLLSKVNLSSQIKIDTLFIKGADSSYISNEDEPEIQNSFSHFKIVTIPGANHWVHSTAPKLFIEELNRFIAFY